MGQVIILKVLIATFCDGARAQGDRLDILGAGVRMFFAEALPTDIRTWLATLIATDDGEIGTKQVVNLRVFDADMNGIGDLQIIITTKKADRPGLGAQMAGVTPLKLRCTKEGTYRAQIDVNGNIASSWPFEVVVGAKDSFPFPRLSGY